MPHRSGSADLTPYRPALIALLRAAAVMPTLSRKELNKLLRIHLKETPTGRKFFSNDELVRAYHAYAGTDGIPPFDAAFVERLRLKPVRTTSGVTTLTVLTKPFPCPGECIFCPNDVRMPKSYLADEPGAQRAEQNAFDPYLQTFLRLQAYHNMGHPTAKIEVIILGGTWSFYPENYQIWFVRRVFDALHDFGAGVDHTAEVRAALEHESQFGYHPDRATLPTPPESVDGLTFAQTYNQVVGRIYQAEIARSREAALRDRTLATEYATWEELEAAHRQNESAPCRCVGLVIETRPDHISAAEVLRLRRLGCTKVQIGIQSLDDEVLRLNKRGHTVAATRRAMRLLRAGGFKIHAHWMPNLYGSSPVADNATYQKLFDDPDFCPDELKIYPCSLISSAELMQHYTAGTWRPYTHAELLELLADCFRATPEYCRLTRVIRDIPGTDIVAGNRVTNFRQVVEDHLAAKGEASRDIRAREVKGQPVSPADLHLDEMRYPVSTGTEVFLQFITAGRQVAGFLRLSLPTTDPITPELAGAAMIREVHVYGQALHIGELAEGRAQHAGLGLRLIDRAVEIARAEGYGRLAVISAIGTRVYYRKRGFTDGQLYQLRDLARLGAESGPDAGEDQDP